MMDILIFSRPAIESLDPPEVPHVIISINCPNEGPARIRTNGMTLGRVNLFFWDADCHPDGMTQETFPIMCSQDARDVVDLVQGCPQAEQILVHCSAGRSRSAGVAAALHKVINGSDEIIFRDPRYDPNVLVYRRILKEWIRQVGTPVVNEDGTTGTRRIVEDNGSGWVVSLLRALQLSRSGDTVVVPDVEMATLAEKMMTLKGITGVRVVVDKRPYERA